MIKQKKHLKWVGSKEQSAAEIAEILPVGARLVEPFCGSARIWLAAQEKYNAVLLADINQDLIDYYVLIQKDYTRIVDCASKWFGGEHNNPDAYYAMREDFNNAPRGLKRSAMFFWLNWHGYNGLCRYNQAGGYNVPFGRYTKPEIPIEGLRKLSLALINAEIFCVDWARLLSSFLRPDDVIYCDPPYLGTEKSFTAYVGKRFTMAHQAGLARAADRLRSRGYSVFISNTDSDLTRQLYSSADQFHTFSVQRSCAPKAEQRIKIAELLAVYGDLSK